MKQVYHLRFATTEESIPFDNAATIILEKLLSIKNFIKDRIENSPISQNIKKIQDKEVYGFFFLEIVDYAKRDENFDNISIDSPDFIEIFRAKISSKMPEPKNDLSFTEISFGASFIMDTEAIYEEDLWKYDFMDLSKMLKTSLSVFGYYQDLSDVIYQSYSSGDYDTGMIALQQEVFDGPESDYLMSENPDSFPQDAIFELSTYNM